MFAAMRAASGSGVDDEASSSTLGLLGVLCDSAIVASDLKKMRSEGRNSSLSSSHPFEVLDYLRLDSLTVKNNKTVKRYK
jgi:hypothetical protein